ncbi:hypothetical protein [Streptomonospora salina]|uniref:Uncharacterized protein n=1 Tax=Streptomonospora salina TaxID=104205 RepID=A0A841E5K1_9ACTN|nr:hypothetical protein [Streptomonospora salina]MBB5998425.1 hypothetical protein [Streptomonospora salina]
MTAGHHCGDTDPDSAEEHPVAPVTDPEAHRALAEDLRALADFLQHRPDLPVSAHTRVEVVYFPNGDDRHRNGEVARVAGLLGTEAHTEGEHTVCGRDFGRAAYWVVAIPEDVMARHRALMSYADTIQPD